MVRVAVSIFFFLISYAVAYADGAIFCGFFKGSVYCFASVNQDSYAAAQIDAEHHCYASGGIDHCFAVAIQPFVNECASLEANNALDINKYVYKTAKTKALAFQDAHAACIQKFGGCFPIITACDGTADPLLVKPIFAARSWEDIKSISLLAALYVLITLLALGALYKYRAAIANLTVHRNLPRELEVYGESIQVLFKRTQRVNWYGRVVFGIVANLSMTKDELAKVRRYWLGRVIAFDSLRRQRQNELARMHLQLAASVKTEAKDKRALSQLWTFLKAILLSVFYLLRALFSFLFGFLFIRITIAKLVRGAVIESKDLVLILQAKTAIEETTDYLKEYLATANTFDGRDEVV
jgi:hypothetical protein